MRGQQMLGVVDARAAMRMEAIVVAEQAALVVSRMQTE